MPLTFMKTGAAAQKLAEQQEQERLQRQSEIGKMWRFFLKEKEDAKITFIDGELNKEGLLDAPRYWEHFINHNGKWSAFVCPEKTRPEIKDNCPICHEIDDRPALVAVFTIIDHRAFTGKDGKVYKDRRKILVAKPRSFEYLTKLAQKRGGLACGHFDVSRLTDKDAAIGSVFDFNDKKPLEELKKLYMEEKVDPATNTKTKVSYFEPADYEKEIEWFSGDDLRKKGLCKPGSYVPSQPTAAGDQTDYSNQL